jgi:hypothetical protein
MRDAPAALHRGVQRVDRGTRNPECVLDALTFHHLHGCFCRSHFRHGSLSSSIAASSLRRRKQAACQQATFLPMPNDMSNILFDLIDT